MEKSDLRNREDVSLLVHTFYGRVRKDDLIGPVFNGVIPEDRWPAHLERLTDFWESVARGKSGYVGNPRIVHQAVDDHEEGTLTQAHFERWIHLWFLTADELFEGPLIGHAKNAAEKMSRVLLTAIVQHRQTPKP